MAPPSKSLRSNAERARERIIAAARRVFAREGMGASVAREAGMGTATMFRRFPAKEELVDAVGVPRPDRVTGVWYGKAHGGTWRATPFRTRTSPAPTYALAHAGEQRTLCPLTGSPTGDRRDADAVGEIDWDIAVDSTIVRARQHVAALAPHHHRRPLRKRSKAPRSTQRPSLLCAVAGRRPLNRAWSFCRHPCGDVLGGNRLRAAAEIRSSSPNRHRRDHSVTIPLITRCGQGAATRRSSDGARTGASASAYASETWLSSR
ncbi:TetR/AcrR family transcriptional regulator [Streptomyces sp. CA-210063]|uniref:helix-turn-helix domain-containing protein n=1 Tax=Streptomyces sp. CA-210063 TaxID=2801029 RepID=UPI00214B3BD3|nr:helix-turn-helix domain-containing protein [Streptomyces sp. CA-210063]UUU28594.1 TetR/AcrR family transcriptional regulator [Streptomyces sp. CA-210063]